MFLVSLPTASKNWTTRAIVIKYNFAKYIFFYIIILILK